MCALFFARKIFYRTTIAHAIWRDDIYPLYAYSLLISFIQRKNNFIVSILLVLRKMIGNIMRNYVSQKILYPLDKLVYFFVNNSVVALVVKYVFIFIWIYYYFSGMMICILVINSWHKIDLSLLYLRQKNTQQNKQSTIQTCEYCNDDVTEW